MLPAYAFAIKATQIENHFGLFSAVIPAEAGIQATSPPPMLSIPTLPPSITCGLSRGTFMGKTVDEPGVGPGGK